MEFGPVQPRGGSFPVRATASFDFVLFCEIIEHLLMNPLHALREIHRVLEPGGLLVLTTPNVARLGNVLRWSRGDNIYDPYSGFGPYGRHNREYTLHELDRLAAVLRVPPSSVSSPPMPMRPRRAPTKAGGATPPSRPSGSSAATTSASTSSSVARTTSQPRTGLPEFLYLELPARPTPAVDAS